MGKLLKEMSEHPYTREEVELLNLALNLNPLPKNREDDLYRYWLTMTGARQSEEAGAMGRILHYNLDWADWMEPEGKDEALDATQDWWWKIIVLVYAASLEDTSVDREDKTDEQEVAETTKAVYDTWFAAYNFTKEGMKLTTKERNVLLDMSKTWVGQEVKPTLDEALNAARLVMADTLDVKMNPKRGDAGIGKGRT